MSLVDPNTLANQPKGNMLQSRPRRELSKMSTRLALNFTLFALFLVGILTLAYFQNTRSQLREDIRIRLRDAVAIGAMQINGDAHALLTNPTQEGDATYSQLKEILQGIRDAGTEIRFVYTMRQDDQGNIFFVVDAEENEEDISHLGDIYDDASALLKDNFPSLSQPVVEEDFYTDKWGTWLTGYAPFYSSDGRREGVLGMDISASSVLARERQAIWSSLLFFFISVPFIVFIGWFLGNRLSAPIAKLSKAAEQITTGDLSVRITTGATSQEVNILENSFNSMIEQLQGLFENLEKRVDERTQDLAIVTEHARKRASQFETIAQISQIITSIQASDTLFTRITEVISQRMGYYHVGIFMLDYNQEFAVLEATNSTGGQQMLKRRHRLKIGEQGIVGYVTSSGNPRIALDVGEDAVFFNNPDLPETRSEMALPLKVAGNVIGALDLQSEKANAFISEDIEVLTILADQLAITIENARSFEQARLAIQKAETALQQQSADSWGQLTKRQVVLGYQYDGSHAKPLKRASGGKVKNTLEVPVRFRGQTIGKLKLNPNDPTRSWSNDEMLVAQAAAERAALALENARLLEEAQHRAAKESLISEISNKIIEATETDKIMAAAVSELQRILGAPEVSFQLSSDEA